MNVDRLVIWNCPRGSPIPRYTVNGLNQLTNAGGLTLTYDNSGNLQSDSTNTYSYDVENRLLGVSGGSTATLSYDPLGRLNQTIGGGNTTRFGAACPEFSPGMVRTSLREPQGVGERSKYQ